MGNVIYVQPEKCTGCRTCELTCSFMHTGTFDPTRSRIAVVGFEKSGFFFPAVCQQCDPAPCMEVCPVGAISRSEATGAMEVNHEVCIRCKMCMIACPFGATFYDAKDNRIIKCDLCGGDPECVKNCPSEALTFSKSSPAVGLKRRAAAAKIKEVLEEVR
ncbi:MAG: 4Fe-4S dicluster domain-containing protein [Syntrophomonadaceae bacterium]|nr:4Fe-4S dicluster domain-containing protein [Syntrophomonadaceae bacterium]